MPGDIDVSFAGVHLATLSANESASLASALWDLGTASKHRGAITFAATLNAAAHRSGLNTRVDVKMSETRAVHEALDGMSDFGPEDGLSGLSDRLTRR